MLGYIREKATGWVAWFIVILISIPFALWGVHGYMNGGNSSELAIVGDMQLSVNNFQQNFYRKLQQQQQQYQKIFGEHYNEDMINQDALKQQVLNEMVDNMAVVAHMTDAGGSIAKAEIDKILLEDSNFQENGQFSKTLFIDLLRANGFSPAGYRAVLTRDLLQRQYFQGVINSHFITEQAIQEVARLTEQKRHIAALILKKQVFLKHITLDDQTLQDYYQSHKADFNKPEQVIIEYLELDKNKMAEGIKPSEQAITDYYEDNKSFYQSEEQRQARHILIAMGADASEEQLKAAKKKAQEVLDKIEKGIDFATLAKEYSDDPGSAKKGGDLGFFGKGVMDNAFEEAVFALKKGEHSQLVKSQFGYHIIELTAIKASRLKLLSEVKEEIKQTLQKEQAEKEFYEKSEILTNKTYEHPDTLEIAAEELAMQVQQSKPFSRQGGDNAAGQENIINNPKVLNAAFSSNVKDNNENSETIEITPDHILVLRIHDVIPEAPQPFEAVKDKIMTKLKSEKAIVAIKKQVKEILSRVKKGENITLLAKEYGLEWIDKGFVKRDNSIFSRKITDAAFSLAIPNPDQMQIQEVDLPRGDKAILALYAVQEPENLTEKELDAARKRLEQGNTQTEAMLALQELKDEINIKINKTLLN